MLYIFSVNIEVILKIYYNILWLAIRLHTENQNILCFDKGELNGPKRLKWTKDTLLMKKAIRPITNT